ncbi:caveolin [Elysia marginata]|uniref:Caveolin n=1 Tax=Elysia marginata TaxID=1093978 RepID=A0AAV4HUC0_9GAST|nr:caveolin [Elysia marginata]
MTTFIIATNNAKTANPDRHCGAFIFTTINIETAKLNRRYHHFIIAINNPNTTTSIVMTICCGMCIALELGCEFGQIIFWHVWCLTPGLKSLFYQMRPCSCLYRHIVRCLGDPWCEAASYCCGAFEEPDKDDTHFRTRLY